MLGFDAWYRNDYDDLELAEISAREGRILLTGDCGLLQRKQVVYGYFIREDNPRDQLRSVLRRYSLFDRIEPFGRCVDCNALLEEVEKQEIIDRLEPKTKKYYYEFYQCTYCDKIYWPGSHYENMKEFIENLKKRLNQLIPCI